MTQPAMTSTVCPVRPGDWAADPAASTLSFAVRNFGLRTVTGQIPLASAVVHVGPGGEPEYVRADLDPGGIDTGNRRRDTDLRGRRFLATDRWPAITFEAGHIQPNETGWTVSGILTVKDARCPIRLQAASPVSSASAEPVDLRVTGRMDRRSAGITAGPAFLIGHNISLSITVRLLPPAGPPPA